MTRSVANLNRTWIIDCLRFVIDNGVNGDEAFRGATASGERKTKALTVREILDEEVAAR